MHEGLEDRMGKGPSVEGSGTLNLEKTGSMGHGHFQVSEGLSQNKGSRHDLAYSGAKLRPINGFEPQQDSSCFTVEKQIPIVRATQIRDELPWIALSSSLLGMCRTVLNSSTLNAMIPDS